MPRNDVIMTRMRRAPDTGAWIEMHAMLLIKDRGKDGTEIGFDRV